MIAINTITATEEQHAATASITFAKLIMGRLKVCMEELPRPVKVAFDKWSLGKNGAAAAVPAAADGAAGKTLPTGKLNKFVLKKI